MSLLLQLHFGGSPAQADRLILTPNAVATNAQIDDVIGQLKSIGRIAPLRLTPNTVSQNADIDDVIGALK